LVLPKATSFRSQNKQVGASVVVQLAPGSSLNPETVRGITYIVANSVEQLNSDDVAVLDDAGHVLSVPAANASVSGLTSRQLDIQQSVEEHLVSKLENLLSTVVGLGRARVQVAAQLNFEQVDRTIESFDPDGQVVQTEQRSETGTGTAAAGAGTQQIISNSYQNSRRLERIVGAVGGVTRLTVAVLVDENALESEELAQGGTANRLASVEAMVRDAIGIDAARGDRLTVTAIPFMPLSGGDGPAIGMTGAPEESFDVINMIQRLSRPILGLAAIVALIVLAWSVLKTTPALPPALSGAKQPSDLPTNPERDLEGGGEAPPAVQLQNHLSKATERPELAAQVVRAWLGGTT
jgi:flagellar M-ring protein FliF